MRHMLLDQLDSGSLPGGARMNRLYAKLNDPSCRTTPSVTIEAIMWAMRERGLEALHDPDVIERLSRCDNAACEAINQRLVNLFPAESAE